MNEKIKKTIFTFLSCLMLLAPMPAAAQGDLPDPDSVGMLLSSMPVQIEATVGVEDMYNFKFDRAASQFNWLRSKYPDHPLPYFLLGLNEWWKIAPNIDNHEFDEDFLAFMDTAITKAEELYDKDEKNAEAAFFLAGGHAFKGRLYAERKSWTKATFAGKRALKFMEAGDGNETLSPEFLFGQGLYNYFAIWVPEHYSILKPVLFFFRKGDKEKGIEQLETVVRDAFYTRTEAQYFLMRIYANDENRPDKAMQIADYLHKSYPDNAYFHRYFARMLFSSGRLNELEPVALNLLEKIEQKMPGYEETGGRYAAFYLAYLYRRRYADNLKAAEYYKKAIEFSESAGATEAGYYVYSLKALGDIAVDNQDLEEALAKYEAVLEFGGKKHPVYKECKANVKNLKKALRESRKKKK